jgi:hypothetical protein
MGIPQVPGQVKRGPTLALRAVFAGIGKILMAADRPEAGARQAAADARGRPATGSKRGQRSGPGPAPVPSRFRSLDQTGNVRLLSAEDLGDDDDDLVTPAPAARGPVAPASGAADTVREPALPLANYDDLSLASIRARLRGLTISQLRTLAEHEARNAERPEVLGMFGRRIEKLEAGP